MGKKIPAQSFRDTPAKLSPDVKCSAVQLAACSVQEVSCSYSCASHESAHLHDAAKDFTVLDGKGMANRTDCEA